MNVLKRIYLDNNATTPLDPSVMEVFETELRETFGNASSIHEEGQRARRVLESAREAVAELIGATAREVVFTSGGTESNNAALRGAATVGKDRPHIVAAAIEHPSALEPVRHLEKEGHPVTWVAPDPEGVVHPESILDAVRDNTGLVALMLANNETGVIQRVTDVGAICRERRIHLHCDAVQAAGKIAVDVRSLGVDTLSLSGHKVHAPKGIGALYVRSGTSLEALVVGGAQERRRRAGTESVPSAAAFGRACAIARGSAGAIDEMRRHRDHFEARLLEIFPDARVNSGRAERLPNSSNITFPGVDAESLVIALDLAGVAASTGSACSSGRVEPSHVLIAMGLSVEDAKSSVRFSLSRFTTAEEIAAVLALLEENVPRHRRGTPAAGPQTS